MTYGKTHNKSPRRINHKATWKSYFLWDQWAHCGIFENGVLLMYTLEGVSSVANFITAYEESQ